MDDGKGGDEDSNVWVDGVGYRYGCRVVDFSIDNWKG